VLNEILQHKLQSVVVLKVMAAGHSKVITVPISVVKTTAAPSQSFRFSAVV